MAELAPETVNVQLTDRGTALANGAPLRISNGHASILIAAGAVIAVELARDWKLLLSLAHDPKTGEPLVRIAPAEAAPSRPATPITGKPEAPASGLQS